MEVASLKEIEFLKDLSDYKISLLKEYMNFTLEENKKFNLTSLDSEDEFIVKNILDSLLVVKFLQDDFSNKRVVDIGKLEKAHLIESITPLLIGLNIKYKSHYGGFRLTGIDFE